jgi:hypothetical protein
MEMELVGADIYVPKMLWSLYFMDSQGYDTEIIELYQDNKSAELLMKNRRFLSGKRTKHIEAKFFFIKDRIDDSEIRVIHHLTEEMWADILPKPLQGKASREMQVKLMNCSIDYEAQEAAFQETLAQAKAGRRTTYPVTGQAAKQGAN